MPEQRSMIFGFRGVRFFQVLCSLTALGCAVGAVFIVRAVADGATTSLMAVVAAVLGLLFLWLFSMALRVPTSFVAIAPERTRIRFSPFVDTVVDNADIVGARVRKWPIYRGIGLRTNFNDEAGIITIWGPAAEVTFRRPLRIWLIPHLIPVRATRITLSLRNPDRLVERFGPTPTASQRSSGARKMKARGSRTR